MDTAVTTTTGRLQGVDERHADRPLAVFRGIPFAEPPVGPLRWRAPEPRRPWNGTREARSFGPAAPQAPDTLGTALPPEAFVVGPTDEAECLTLNVWAPADPSGPRPVLVWLYGGAFMTGGSAMPSYDGATLAAEAGVVVVSANYRVGALGFVPVAGQANVGLLDQLLALTWVGDNIAAFGGDPSRVTVFGESAGAGSVLHLLASPRSDGLIRRAIAQSGATDLTLTADQTAEIADRFRLALDGDPAQVPTDAVIAAQNRVLADVASTIGVMPFHPSSDGDVVPAAPAAALRAGASRTVDLLLGTTADEMALFLDDASRTLSDTQFASRARRYLGGGRVDAARVDELIGAYAGLPSGGERWSALQTDSAMWVPFLDVAEAHQGRTFAYRFDWPAAPPKDHLGACHAIDIPFTFATFDRCGWGAFVGADADAIALSRALRSAWAAFAATGDPSTEGLGPWPEHTAPVRSTMLLDRSCRLVEDPRADIRRAWEAARA